MITAPASRFRNLAKDSHASSAISGLNFAINSLS